MLWLTKLELGPPVRWANISVVAAKVWSRLGEECGGATVLKISDSRSYNPGISFPLPLTMFMIGLLVFHAYGNSGPPVHRAVFQKILQINS